MYFILKTVRQWLHWLCRLLHLQRIHHYNKVPLQEKNSKTKPHYRCRKKPQWVIDEVIKIKAYQPNLSCRLISELFNDRFDTISISKSYVAYTVKTHNYHIQILRKKIKSKPAYNISFNKVWGIDLTFVNQKPLLGVIEHHSRQCLQLIPLQQKTTINILLALLSILKNTPKPKIIRTDNEACFTSRLMKTVLWIIGIKHQTIQKHCPWQNGRIERFFGTFKQSIKAINIPTENHWFLCQDFAYWYNHIRPHQNLNYQTPNSVFGQQLKNWKPPDQ